MKWNDIKKCPPEPMKRILFSRPFIGEGGKMGIFIDTGMMWETGSYSLYNDYEDPWEPLYWAEIPETDNPCLNNHAIADDKRFLVHLLKISTDIKKLTDCYNDEKSNYYNNPKLFHLIAYKVDLLRLLSKAIAKEYQIDFDELENSVKILEKQFDKLIEKEYLNRDINEENYEGKS